MRINLSAWSVRRPFPVSVLFLVLIPAGLAALGGIPVTRTPAVDVPVVSVTVRLAGATPTALERDVTTRIEREAATIPGVRHVRSHVAGGESATEVEFAVETPSDRALAETRDAIERARPDLPEDAGAPLVGLVDVVGQPVATYAVSVPGMTPDALTWFVDDVVVRALRTVPGVARVTRTGGVEPEIAVRIDPDRLTAAGVTMDELGAALRAAHRAQAAGREVVGGVDQPIRIATGEGLTGLAHAVLSLPHGGQIRLGDIGRIALDHAPGRTFAEVVPRIPVLGVSIERARGWSDVAVAASIERRLWEIQRSQPRLVVRLVDNPAAATWGRYHAALRALSESCVLAVVVVFLFLRDWRATIVASLALPLSILPALLPIHLLGFSFNFVSLLAITLASGVLLDDSIVEIEAIKRHLDEGKSPDEAAIDASAQIGLAVVAISLALVVIFMPVSFMSGFAGQYFRQFGLTVAITTLCSLLVARVVTPPLAARLLRRSSFTAAPKPAFSGSRILAPLLDFSLRKPRRSIAMTYAIVVAALVAATLLLPTDFLPAEDDARSVLQVEAPPGRTLDDLRRSMEVLSARLQHEPDIAGVYVVGGQAPDGALAQPRDGYIVLRLVPKARRGRSQRAVEAALAPIISSVSDLRGWFVTDRDARQFSVSLLATNPAADAALEGVAASLVAAMQARPEFTEVTAEAALLEPELAAEPLPEAAAIGVTPEAISAALRLGTSGDDVLRLPRINVDGRRLPVRMTVDPGELGIASTLATLPVRGRDGRIVPLDAVARLVRSDSPSAVDRTDQSRRITIGADLATGVALGTATGLVMSTDVIRTLPPGISVVGDDDDDMMIEMFAQFRTALGAGLVLVFAVLAMLFGNLLQPITVFATLPLALGGAALALLATGQAINMAAVIGVLMLFGIVSKNSILIIDQAILARKTGLARDDALRLAIAERSRPVIMTTLAMVAGMTPSALGIGEGGEFRAPMAICVIGGLIVATALSLLIVPATYVIVDDLGRLPRRLRRPQLAMPQDRTPGLVPPTS